MITDKQKALAKRVAQGLRDMADAVEESVSDDPAIRLNARHDIELNMRRNGTIASETIDRPGNSLLYDYCRHCKGETDGTEDVHEECEEEHANASYMGA
ncbi:MAG: hypothetical protein P4L84_34940 [Isosphaeraceae bacterium]|nr:hypothetical protein [Isosphaeraceae bacterium]